MQIVNKPTMFTLAVSDMPKAKAFYADTLGLKVTQDYRQDDQNWWVTLTPPEGAFRGRFLVAKVQEERRLKR